MSETFAEIMTTAVRIKRKAEGSPADTIVLAPKKARVADTKDKPDEKFTFQYAGTVNSHADVEAAVKQVKEASRLRTDPKVHPVDLLAKLRTEHRSASKESRLQLMLQHRAAMLKEVCSEVVPEENVEAPSESAYSLFRLYDLCDLSKKSKDMKENEHPKEGTSKVSCSGVPMAREKAKETTAEDGYVYDVYFNNIDCSSMGEKDEYSLFRTGPPDAFAQHDTTICDSDTGRDVVNKGDSDDSNEEDYWRNDYTDDGEHCFPKEPELDDEESDEAVVSHRLDDLNFTDYFLLEHIPLSASEHVGPLLRKMFPKSDVAKRYACSRTKTAATVGEMARHAQESMVSALGKSVFAVAIDCSNDSQAQLYRIVVTYFVKEFGLIES